MSKNTKGVLVMLGILFSMVVIYLFFPVGADPVPEEAVRNSVGLRPAESSGLSLEEGRSLRAQLDVYYDAWKRQDAETMWSLFDRYARDVGPKRPFFGADSKKQFEESGLISYEIQNITMRRGIVDVAVVRANLTLFSEEKQVTREEMDTTLWILSKFEDRWYYDGQEPVANPGK